MATALISLSMFVNILHTVDLSDFSSLRGRKLSSSCADREPHVCDSLGVSENCTQWSSQGFNSFPELICQESCNTCPPSLSSPPSPPSSACTNAWWCPDTMSDAHCSISVLSTRCPVTCKKCTVPPDCLQLAPSDDKHSISCTVMPTYTLIPDRCTAYDVFLLESKALGGNEYTCQ